MSWHCPPDTEFEPWRSEAEHATARSRGLPTILSFTHGWGRNIFVSFKPPRTGTEPRTLAWKAAVLTTILGPPPLWPPTWFLESRGWLRCIFDREATCGSVLYKNSAQKCGHLWFYPQYYVGPGSFRPHSPIASSEFWCNLVLTDNVCYLFWSCISGMPIMITRRMWVSHPWGFFVNRLSSNIA